MVAFCLLISCNQPDATTTVLHQTNQKIIKQKNNNSFHIATPIAVSYQADKLRSPFENTQDMSQSIDTDKPLTLYPLNMLKFVGTLTANDKYFAYLLTPDNKVYRVTVGDNVGNHHGKVVRIGTNRLNVTEPDTNSNNPTKQNVIVLQLKDENK